MGGSFSIDLQREPGGLLRAHVRGDAGYASTVEYWRAIAAELARRPAACLLLVDELTGPPLAAAEWQALVRAMSGTALEGVRIAHVKPHGLERVEHCEIFALEAGLQARVFVSERAGVLWLRYGPEPAESDGGQPLPERSPGTR